MTSRRHNIEKRKTVQQVGAAPTKGTDKHGWLRHFLLAWDAKHITAQHCALPTQLRAGGEQSPTCNVFAGLYILTYLGSY